MGRRNREDGARRVTELGARLHGGPTSAKIVDLAERMIKLSSLQPGHDIDIVFTGMRPGERLNEILFAFEEETVEIGIAGIVAARPRESSLDAMRAWLTTLHKAVDDERRSLIEVVLKDAIPEFAIGAGLASQSVTARIEQAQP